MAVGDAIRVALVVHLYDHGVSSIMDVAGDFELKGGKTAFMLAEFLAIEEDDGLNNWRRRTRGTGGGRASSRNRIRAYTRWFLRTRGIPASGCSSHGHLEYRGVRHEGEFQAIASCRRDAVGAEPAAWNGMQMEVIVAGFVGIDDDLPWPVQAEVLAGGRVLDQPDLLGVTRDIHR